MEGECDFSMEGGFSGLGRLGEWPEGEDGGTRVGRWDEDGKVG